MSQYTPEEMAYNIALGWLRNAFEGNTADIDDAVLDNLDPDAVRDEVGRLHDKLLEESGMDGMPLLWGMPLPEPPK